MLSTVTAPSILSMNPSSAVVVTTPSLKNDRDMTAQGLVPEADIVNLPIEEAPVMFLVSVVRLAIPTPMPEPASFVVTSVPAKPLPPFEQVSETCDHAIPPIMTSSIPTRFVVSVAALVRAVELVVSILALVISRGATGLT